MRKPVVCFLLHALTILLPTLAQGGEPRMSFLRAGEVLPEGWMRHQMTLDLREGLTGHYHKVSNAVNLRVFEKQDRPAGGLVDIPGENRQKSWWSGEHEGYWKDSIVRMAFLLDDQREKKRVTQWMRALLDAQDEDGYIGVYSRDTRFPAEGENGELWTQSRIFQAMLAYHEFTGDEEVLRAVERAVELTLSKYQGTSYFSAANGQGGLSHGVGYMDTLEWLHRLTGKAAYRDGAVWLYEDYQNLPSRDQDMKLDALLNPAQPWEEHTPHIMEGLHMPAVVHRLTGDAKYARAAAAALAKFDRHANPGGGVVGDESVQGRPGSADMPAEYCTMTEGVSSLNRIAAWQGDLTAGERVERVCLNAAQGARFQPVNRAVRYLTSDNQQRADDHRHRQRFLFSAWHDAAACCTLNSGRLLPYYVEGMWYRDPSRNALVANLYGPCRVQTTVAGSDVRIVEKTDYPFSDRIEFKVSVSRPVEFTLSLRLPPGGEEFELDIDADAKVQRNTNRIDITRLWKRADRFAIDFNFEVRREQDRNGEFYFQWGPLVFSLPLAEERKAIREFAALDGEKSGFHMWEIRPADDSPWSYRLAADSEFALASLSEGDMLTPWSNSPIGLEGELLNADGKPVPVTLKPLGCSLLRRTSFPLAEAARLDRSPRQVVDE
jgi:hypothetical protein